MRIAFQRRGAALIEVIIGLVIVAACGSAFLALVIHSVRGWCSGTGRDTATSQATIALQKIANETRDARTAVASGGILTVTFPKKVKDAGTGEETYDLSLNDPVTRTYYVENGNLVRSVGGHVSILGRGVSKADFGADGGVVTVTLTGEEQVGAENSKQIVVGCIYLRNYRS